MRKLVVSESVPLDGSAFTLRSTTSYPTGVVEIRYVRA